MCWAQNEEQIWNDGFNDKTSEKKYPNITGKFGCAVPENHSYYSTGSFGPNDFGSYYGNITDDGVVKNRIIYGYDIQAYKSSNIFNRSNTVQPKSFRYLTVCRT